MTPVLQVPGGPHPKTDPVGYALAIADVVPWDPADLVPMTVNLERARLDAVKLRARVDQANVLAKLDANVEAALEAGSLDEDETWRRVRDALTDDFAIDRWTRMFTGHTNRFRERRDSDFRANGPKITTEALQPRLVEILGATWKHAETLADHLPVPDPERLLAEPKPVQEAWRSMGPLAASYAALRETQAILSQHRNSADAWRFHELKNRIAVVGAEVMGREPPWPQEPRSRLLWLVTAIDPRPEVWVPTDEQLAEHVAEHRAGREREKAASAAGFE